MGDVVNLRQFRKARNRAEKKKLAEANREKFGRSKPERERERAAKKRDDAHLDGHLRETDEDGPEPA